MTTDMKNMEGKVEVAVNRYTTIIVHGRIQDFEECSVCETIQNFAMKCSRNELYSFIMAVLGKALYCSQIKCFAYCEM